MDVILAAILADATINRLPRLPTVSRAHAIDFERGSENGSAIARVNVPDVA